MLYDEERVRYTRIFTLTWNMIFVCLYTRHWKYQIIHQHGRIIFLYLWFKIIQLCRQRRKETKSKRIRRILCATVERTAQSWIRLRRIATLEWISVQTASSMFVYDAPCLKLYVSWTISPWSFFISKLT